MSETRQICRKKSVIRDATIFFLTFHFRSIADARLGNISQDVKVSTSTWSESAYDELLELLSKRGHERQRDVIIGAARAGGYIERAEIGKILGWGDAKKHLTRFRMPADRAKAELVERGQVSQDAGDPLWAVYDGPGEAIGYAVPDVFAEIQLELDGDGGE